MKTNEMPPAAPERGEAKAEKKEKNIFLEIGTGHSPMVFTGARKFTGDDQYIGVDLVTRKFAFGQKENINLDHSQKMARSRRSDENISFLHADGTKLPFADGSIGEVYISNVFGDPSVDRKVIDGIVAEAGRVLKDGGVFTIRETNTPADTERVSAELAAGGFDVVRLVSISDKDWTRFTSNYHPQQEGFDDQDSYYLVAVKPSKK